MGKPQWNQQVTTVLDGVTGCEHNTYMDAATGIHRTGRVLPGCMIINIGGIMANTPKKFLQVVQGESGLTFQLGNGLRVEFDPEECSEEIQTQAMFHGFNQKIRDSAAGFSKTQDYSGAFGAMQGVVDNLLAGLWNAKGGTGTADIVQAVANLKKIEVSEAQGIIDGLDEEQMKALMAKPVLKAEVARIKLERANAIAAATEDDDLGI